MLFSIPYGRWKMNFEVAEKSVIFTGEMGELPSVGNVAATTTAALDSPIGTPPLKELARGKKNILFLVDDNTRDTPLKELLPLVAGYLNDNGIDDGRISLLTAPGTHRPMTEGEIIEKLGEETVSRFQIFQHDSADFASIGDLGNVRVMDYDIPVRVNSRVLRADLVVGFGNIIPHCNAGFSGGGKIVIPGVSDIATTAAVHAASAFHKSVPLGENDGNPCRMAIEAGAERAGLKFIINVVLNRSGTLAGIFAGDFITAQRAGSALAARLFQVEVPERADIVIAGAYPADADFWQAGKGLAAAFMAVKNGGVIILAADCREGLAHNHPRYREYLRNSLEENLMVIRNSRPGDVTADIIAASVAAENCKIRDWAKVFIVTDGLAQEDITALGFTKFDDIRGALDAAASLNPGASVGIMPAGGHALPVLHKC